MTQHDVAQHHAVAELLGSDATADGRLVVVAVVLSGDRVAAEVRMTLRTEPVEGASHVYFFLGVHVEEGEVDGAAPRMSAFLGDIVLCEEHALVEVGIEVGLHAGVGNVFRPAHEMVDGLLRPVGIVDFQTVAFCLQLVAHGAQFVGSLSGEHRLRLEIAVDALAHKVVKRIMQNGRYKIS